jgi:hypothetical protein
VLELGRCQVAQPVKKLHLVRPERHRFRSLCGLLVGKGDLFTDTAGGWSIWRDWPQWRCHRCEAEAQGWVNA